MKIYIKHAREILKKNKGIFIITTFMISFTSILMFVAIFFSIIGHQFSQYLNNSQKISILFDANTPTAEIESFINDYKQNPAIKNIYQKKPEEIMQEFLPSDYNVPPEDLIKIIRIDLKANTDTKDLIDSILQKQASTENIIEVIYLPNLYQKLHTVALWGNILSILTLIIFTSISMLLIFITLKLGLEKLKKELQIMHDIGAPYSFLEKPLLITTLTMIFSGEILTVFAISLLIYMLKVILHQLGLTEFIKIVLTSLHLHTFISPLFFMLIISMQFILYAIVARIFVQKLIKSYHTQNA